MICKDVTFNMVSENCIEMTTIRRRKRRRRRGEEEKEEKEVGGGEGGGGGRGRGGGGGSGGGRGGEEGKLRIWMKREVKLGLGGKYKNEDSDDINIFLFFPCFL